MVLLWPCMRMRKKSKQWSSSEVRLDSELIPASFPICPFDGTVFEMRNRQVDCPSMCFQTLGLHRESCEPGLPCKWFQGLIGYHVLFVIFSSSLWMWKSSKVTLVSRGKIKCLEHQQLQYFYLLQMKGAFSRRAEVHSMPRPSYPLHSR